MKYVIGFGAICVISGLAATFWLWWYSERSLRLRASSVGTRVPRMDDNGNSIVQPLLAEEHGGSSASKPQRDSHTADAIEAQQQQQFEATPSAGDAGGGAVAAPSVDVQRGGQQEQQRKDSNNSSSGRGSSSNNIQSPPKAVETLTLVGEPTPEEAKGPEASFDSPATLQPPEESRAPAAAAREGQKQQDSKRSNSISNISSSPVARVDGNGDSQEDPPAGEEGNGARVGTGELGELRKVPPSEGEGEPASTR